ncbi:hypothetical protein BGY98DRAFT_102868 [Russula aff. rugulosa BPL654]|nr:hypothetical protein BGY98DRAFT_102868 [Russula aff. rugulosa BPL654]
MESILFVDTVSGLIIDNRSRHFYGFSSRIGQSGLIRTHWRRLQCSIPTVVRLSPPVANEGYSPQGRNRERVPWTLLRNSRNIWKSTVSTIHGHFQTRYLHVRPISCMCTVILILSPERIWKICIFRDFGVRISATNSQGPRVFPVGPHLVSLQFVY